MGYIARLGPVSKAHRCSHNTGAQGRNSTSVSYQKNKRLHLPGSHLGDRLYRFDALIYTRALAARSPGTHNLHVIEDADHNFVGVSWSPLCRDKILILVLQHYDEVVDTILDWWSKRSKSELQTGIWLTGVRGKL